VWYVPKSQGTSKDKDDDADVKNGLHYGQETIHNTPLPCNHTALQVFWGRLHEHIILLNTLTAVHQFRNYVIATLKSTPDL